MGKVKYIHNEVTHNMTSPNIIVPIIKNIVNNVDSVIDFGCGIGTWLKAFKNDGTKNILGVDGDWVNKELLYKYIDKSEFMTVDLEKPIKLEKTYDLAISLEVAEHISSSSSDIFVKSLVDASKIILFSAAIPGQGGFNHINEQWPSYWMEKFKIHNYHFYDIIRDKIWNNSEIEYFYKQNIFIVAHESVRFQSYENEIMTGIYDIVHPDGFKDKVNYIKKIEEGKRGFSFYIPLLLKKIKTLLLNKN